MRRLPINRKMLIRVTRYYGALRSKYKRRLIQELIEIQLDCYDCYIDVNDMIIKFKYKRLTDFSKHMHYTQLLKDTNDFFDKKFAPYMHYICTFPDLSKNLHHYIDISEYDDDFFSRNLLKNIHNNIDISKYDENIVHNCLLWIDNDYFISKLPLFFHINGYVFNKNLKFLFNTKNITIFREIMSNLD